MQLRGSRIFIQGDDVSRETGHQNQRRWQRSSRAREPIELTAGPGELRTTLRAVFARDDRLSGWSTLEATNQVNICMSEALQKQGFVMKP